MTHTPGPWGLEPWLRGCGLDRGAFVVRPDAEPSFVIVGRSEVDHRIEESRANACLIAAAPDLLAAARQLVESAPSRDPVGWADGVYALERAIAKAEGR